MKKLIALIIFLSVMFIAACGSSGDSIEGETNANTSLEPLKVEFITKPDTFQPGKEGTIEVKVTQGDQNVTDADEVLFEIWNKGHQDKSEKYEAENKGKGVYSLKHSFNEKGVYKVTAHVTARSMHTMPAKEFNVGRVEEKHAHGNHHDENNLMVMLMKEDTIQANKEATLMAHLQKDNKPLTGASVRFEYWMEGQDKHTFVETEEKEAGKYQAKIMFNEPGNYTVKTHVKKDDLHSHKEETIEVQ
ncbi:FixH family protein [Virgibacillus kekensis]|uniref:FixH family protein n=1 Tax=Virgibacillus kekensis TaxID=202261 RepID=A0ABV9DPN0_9BACI